MITSTLACRFIVIFLPIPGRESCRRAEMAMLCLTDFENYAKERLSKDVWDYYAGGADENWTRDDNLLAYRR